MVPVAVAVGVAVLVGVLVTVSVAGVPVMIGVAVGLPEPLGLEGALSLHPTIKATGSNVITIKQLISFFIFTSPLNLFWNTTTGHGIQAYFSIKT